MYICNVSKYINGFCKKYIAASIRLSLSFPGDTKLVTRPVGKLVSYRTLIEIHSGLGKILEQLLEARGLLQLLKIPKFEKNQIEFIKKSIMF